MSYFTEGMLPVKLITLDSIPRSVYERASDTEGTRLLQVHQIWKISKSTDVQQYCPSLYNKAHLADKSWRAIQG